MTLAFEHCLLVAAKAELGRGESGGNNDGPDVWRFREWIDDDQPWCAAFCYYVLVQAAESTSRPLPKPLRRTLGALRLGVLIGQAGQVLTVPEPGCFVVWYRGPKGSGKGHIGIVEGYDAATDTLYTIEGNKGPAPSPVARYTYAGGKEWRTNLAMVVTTRKPPTSPSTTGARWRA